MTLVNLHPEELLERETRGELSAAEREVLESHSRQCAVCRLERMARADFRSEAEQPEAEADVQRLLAAAWPLAIQKVARRPSRKRAMRHARFVMAAAAAVITMTGLAAASRWSGGRIGIPWTTPPSPAAPAANAVASPAPRHHAATVPAAPAPATATVESEPQAPVIPVPVAATDSVPAPAPIAARASREASALAARPAPVAPEMAVATDEAAGAPALFHRANEARQAGDHVRAGELYGRLLNRFGSSAEAHVSLAMFGRMLFDDGNAAGALRCFDDYLRQGGALREDVMVGRAMALQRLGRAGEEASAWSSLLDAYPGSVHAGRARRRLLELGRG
jgi:hypothetical protein